MSWPLPSRRQALEARPTEPAPDIGSLWAVAIEHYRRSLDVDLQERSVSFINDIENCCTAEDILDVLENTSECLNDKRHGGRASRILRKTLAPVVHCLSLIIDAGGESASYLGVPGGKGIFAAIAVLLKAADGVSATYDDLKKLFERLGAYVERLRARVEVPMSSGTRDIAVRALVETLKALALATRMLRKNRLGLFLKALFTKSNEVRSAIHNLETIVSDEEKMVVTDVVIGMHELSSQVLSISTAVSDLLEVSDQTAQNARLALEEVRGYESRRALDNNAVLDLLRTIADHLSSNIVYGGITSGPLPLLSSSTADARYITREQGTEIGPSPGVRHVEDESEARQVVLQHRPSGNPALGLAFQLQNVVSRFCLEDQEVIYRALHTLFSWTLAAVDGSQNGTARIVATIHTPTHSVLAELGSISRPFGWAPGTVIIIGLCDEIFELDSETFSTWENTHAYLLRAFQGRLGASYVKERNYGLGDSEHLLIEREEWSLIVQAGSRLHMSIVIPSKGTLCPFCGARSNGHEADERFRCLTCKRLYGAFQGTKIEDGHTSSVISNTTPTAGGVSSCCRPESEGAISVDSVNPFHRVIVALEVQEGFKPTADSGTASWAGGERETSHGDIVKNTISSDIVAPNPQFPSLISSDSRNAVDFERSSSRSSLQAQASVGDLSLHTIRTTRSRGHSSEGSSAESHEEENDRRSSSGGNIDGATQLPSAQGQLPLYRTLRFDIEEELTRALGNMPEHTISDSSADNTSPWYLSPDYAEGMNIVFDHEGNVLGGAVPALVERLTTHQHMDPRFTTTFLLVFKRFTDIDTLVGLLIKRFWIPLPEDLAGKDLEEWRRLKQHIIRIRYAVSLPFSLINTNRVLNTIKTMILDDDVIEEKDMYVLDQLMEFVQHSVVQSMAAGKHLLMQIQRIRFGHGARVKMTTSYDPPPTSIVPRSNRGPKLLEFDPLEVARQLTIIENNMFLNIKASECLARSREQKGASDNISAAIETSDKIAHWVADAVLEQEDARKRALIVKHFIQVADRCRDLRNFSSMNAIISALNSPPVRRLKWTWDLISQKFIGMLSACVMTLDSENNFNNYCQLLQRITPPCVPLISVYLTMLTFIQDGVPDLLSGDLVNFSKHAKAAEKVQEIQRWQSKPFNFARVQLIADYLQEQLKKFNDVPDVSDVFWNRSLEREPNESEEDRIARLLRETGFLA